ATAEPFPLSLPAALPISGRDGLWLLEEIRRIAPAIPVVILTGHVGLGREAELLERGAAGILLKPPSIPDLLQLIRRVLPGRPARSEEHTSALQSREDLVC